VTEHALEPEDEFLLLGCDGLWDVFSSQRAVEFARGRLQVHNDPAACSRELVRGVLMCCVRATMTVPCNPIVAKLSTRTKKFSCISWGSSCDISWHTTQRHAAGSWCGT